MKKHILIIVSVLIILVQCFNTTVKGQTQVVNFLNYGVDNAQALSRPFLEPYAGMIDACMISGWNMSPRVLRPGRFTLHYFYNMGFSGTNKLINIQQMITDGQLNNVTLVSGNGMAPTAINRFPDLQERPELSYEGESYTVPNGENLNSINLPVVSASVGISFNTELSIRFTPPMEYSNLGKSLMWGVGIKHDLVPYFGFMQKHPFLETAIVINYSDFSSNVELSYMGQSGQSLDVKGKIFSGRFLIGAHFNSVDIYGSAGYGNRTSDMMLKGTFTDIPGPINSQENPVDVNYDFSSFVYEAGAQIRVYFINLQASYTMSKYSMVSLGAGLSF